MTQYDRDDESGIFGRPQIDEIERAARQGSEYEPTNYPECGEPFTLGGVERICTADVGHGGFCEAIKRPQFGDTRLDQYGQTERYGDMLATGEPRWEVLTPKPRALEYVCQDIVTDEPRGDDGCGRLWTGAEFPPDQFEEITSNAEAWPLPGLCLTSAQHASAKSTERMRTSMSTSKPRTNWDPRSEMAKDAVKELDTENHEFRTRDDDRDMTELVGLCARCRIGAIADIVVIVAPEYCEGILHKLGWRQYGA